MHPILRLLQQSVGVDMLNQLRQILRSKSGATAIEYGLIGALLSISIIGGATLVGNNVESLFNKVGSDLSNAVN
jgi:pilus assembly protein Flp/PilA